MALRMSPQSPYSLLDRLKTFQDLVAEVITPEEAATLRTFVAKLQDEEHRRASAAAKAEQAAMKAEMDKRAAPAPTEPSAAAPAEEPAPAEPQAP
jgi:hypothetical protein